jgi:phosphatidate cytidylyltransferase
VIAAWAFGLPVPLLVMAIVGAGVSLGAMIGDLCESLIKREIGIKDMGAIIPGHGGLLDRIDALLVTIPLVYYVAVLLEWLGWPG